MCFYEEVFVISFELFKVFHLYLISSMTAKHHWLQDDCSNSVKVLYVSFCREGQILFLIMLFSSSGHTFLSSSLSLSLNYEKEGKEMKIAEILIMENGWVCTATVEMQASKSETINIRGKEECCTV